MAGRMDYENVDSNTNELKFFNTVIETKITGAESFSIDKELAKTLDDQLDLLRTDTNNLHRILTVSTEEFNQGVWVVTLPLVNFKEVFNRFNFNQAGCSVEFVITELVRRVYLLLDQHRVMGYPLHITGSEGIGKSAAIYMCYYTLRMRRAQGIRVTYIADCGVWMGADCKYSYILSELIQTFHADLITSSTSAATSADDWAKYVMKDSESQFERLCEYVRATIEMIQREGLFWYVIFDNHNRLFANLTKKDPPEPFTIIDWLCQKLQHLHCGLVVVANSRNNEYHEIGKIYSTVDLEIDENAVSLLIISSALKLSEPQIGVMLSRLGLIAELKYNNKELTLVTKALMSCTEGIPGEIYEYVTLIKKKPTGDLDADKKKFLFERCREIRKQLIGHYVKPEIGKEKFDQVMCQVVMGAHCTVGQYDAFVDKRFANCMKVEGSELEDLGDDSVSEDHVLVVPINETVNRVFKRLVYELGGWYDTAIATIISLKYLNPGARYSHVEHYIIHRLSRVTDEPIGWELNYRNIDNVQEKYERVITLHEKFSVKHFKGNGAPEFPFKNKATVYVPDNQFYQGVDLLMYLPHGDNDNSPILYAVQVTGVDKPQANHMEHDVNYFWPSGKELHDTRSHTTSVPECQRAWAEYCEFVTDKDTNDTVINQCISKVVIVWFLLHEPEGGHTEKRPYLLWSALAKLCPLINSFKLPEEV